MIKVANVVFHIVDQGTFLVIVYRTFPDNDFCHNTEYACHLSIYLHTLPFARN